MGDYKEKHGKTRVGKFLQGLGSVAPDLITLAGNVTGVEMLENLGKKIKGSPSLSENDKQIALDLLKLDIQESKDISERWKSDMTSDSWLSKNVRPITLIFLTLFVCSIIVSDSVGNISFDVKEVYISLLEALLVTVYIAYFGSRGVEKYTKLRK